MSKAGSAYVDIDARLDKMRATLKRGTAGLSADLNLDIDRAAIKAQLTALTADLRFDVDRAQLAAVTSGLSVDINAQWDMSSLMWMRTEALAYLSGLWVDINVRLDATTLAAMQAQLAALSAQAGSIGTGAAAAAGGGAGAGLLTGAALGVGGAAAIGGAAVFGLGAYGANLAADNETARLSFERLLGSEQAALAYLEELRDFAAVTPFDFPGIRDAASRFLAVGVEADRVIPIMETLGDATSAMGTGAEGVDRATRALTQMSQKGLVSAEEMLQLTEAGIPAWDALAAQIGVDVPAAMDMVTKRLVPAETMFDAIQQKSGAAFERVSGGMKDASGTISGQLSTLKDDMDAILSDVIEPMIPMFKALLPPIRDTLIPLFEDHLAPALEDMGPLIATAMEGFGPFLGLFMDFAGGLAESIEPAMKTLMPMLTDLAAQLGPKMEEIFPELAEAFLSIAEAMVEFAPLIPPTVDLLTAITVATADGLDAAAKAFQWIADIMVGPTATVIGDILSMLGDITTLDWDSATERMRGWVDSVMGMMPELIRFMIDQWNKLDFDIPGVGDVIPDLAYTTGKNLGPGVGKPSVKDRLPWFHDGGRYEAPMGQTEGLAMLRHGEYVLTPEDMARAGGSNRPIKIEQHNHGSDLSPALLGDLAARRIARVLAVQT